MPTGRGFNNELYLTRKGQEANFSDLSVALTTLAEGVLIFDADGHLLAANRAVLEMHGCDRIEDLDHDPKEFSASIEVFGLEEEKLPPEQWPLSRALRGERFSSQEVQIHRLGDESRWVGSYSGIPVSDENGKIKRVVLAVRNVIRERRTHRLLEATGQRDWHLVKASEEPLRHLPVLSHRL